MLAGASLLAIMPFFWRGSPSGHDFEFHLYSWMEVLGQWHHGIVYPRWAALAHWGYGEARFLFYPPASWTLGAILGAILPWKLVPGAYCWIVFTLAGASMYWLAREWFPAQDAMFAAVFYALNPYHLLIIYWRSAYAELLAAIVLPLMLLLLVRLREPRPQPTMWLSLVLAAAWLTNAPAAVMIQYSTAGLALLLAALDIAAARSFSLAAKRLLLRTSVAIILGAGLASLYLIPATYEQGWINISEVMSPGVRPQDNFLFTTIADADHNRFNLLVSILAVSEVGVLIVAIWFSKKTKFADTAIPAAPVASAGAPVIPGNTRIWVVLSAYGLSTAVLMVSVSNLLWQHLPKFRFVQLPFRWLLCMNLALAMLLTMATKRWTTRGLACAILLATVLLLAYRLQPPWWEAAADFREMSNAMADGSGYDGTDEYVPAGADAYELNKSLPRVSNQAGTPVPGAVLLWDQTEKHFVVEVDQPQEITIRLFNYPAWLAIVNGKPAVTRTTDVTGLMAIPVAAGNNDVHIYFRRTTDRLLGSLVSLISLMLLIVGWTWARRVERRTTGNRTTSPAITGT